MIIKTHYELFAEHMDELRIPIEVATRVMEASAEKMAPFFNLSETEALLAKAICGYRLMEHFLERTEITPTELTQAFGSLYQKPKLDDADQHIVSASVIQLMNYSLPSFKTN